MSGEATQYTGPGSRVQGPVSEEEQGEGAEIYRLVLQDVTERAEFGLRKYGSKLRSTSSVDWLVNAYQEALDLCVYLRGEIAKRELASKKEA